MEMPSENGRQSAIEEQSLIGDLNEVAAVSDVETEPEVVTDGGAVVSGVGAPPDSTQTAPLVVVFVEEDGNVAADDGDGEGEDGREIAPAILDEEVVVVDGDGDGDGGAGFVIDLNSDEMGFPNEAIEEEVAIEVIVVVGEEYGGGDQLNGPEVGPDRKRARYGGGDGDFDYGEPSEQHQLNNNLRLFGIDINSGNQENGGGNGLINAGAVASGGGGSPSIQPSVIGLREEEDDGDVISSGGGGGAVDDGDGGEPSSQQPKSGLRLFGHDI